MLVRERPNFPIDVAWDAGALEADPRHRTTPVHERLRQCAVRRVADQASRPVRGRFRRLEWRNFGFEIAAARERAIVAMFARLRPVL
jgi:hypothetical protein